MIVLYIIKKNQNLQKRLWYKIKLTPKFLRYMPNDIWLMYKLAPQSHLDLVDSDLTVLFTMHCHFWISFSVHSTAGRNKPIRPSWCCSVARGMNIKETRAVLNIIQCAHWSRYTDYKLKIHQNQERKAWYTTSSDLELTSP